MGWLGILDAQVPHHVPPPDVKVMSVISQEVQVGPSVVVNNDNNITIFATFCLAITRKSGMFLQGEKCEES